jgi:hypothetical protein
MMSVDEEGFSAQTWHSRPAGSSRVIDARRRTRRALFGEQFAEG